MPLLIVGASVRAAAHSAVRAGLEPVGVDLFGDVDLRAVARWLPVEKYPHDLPRVAQGAPPGPWMYTGAVENHPRIIERICEDRPLLGNRAAAIEGVREPVSLARVLRKAGLPFLEVREETNPPAADGRWMLKPRSSAAGRGIHVWNAAAADAATLRVPHFFQQRATGDPISAVFVASRDQTRLVGISHQFIGLDALNAQPFGWCGAIGPAALESATESAVYCIGRTVADDAGLRGLFGCDFILADGTPMLTEVNPRYTATVELYEWATDEALMRAHVDACLSFHAERRHASSEPAGGIDATTDPVRSGPPLAAKVVLFSRCELPSVTLSQLATEPGRRHECVTARTEHAPGPALILDVPPDGTRIVASAAVCTIPAIGDNSRECLSTLGERIERVGQEVFGRSVNARDDLARIAERLGDASKR